MTKWGTTPTWVATISIAKEVTMRTETKITLFLTKEETNVLMKATEIVAGINHLYDLDENIRNKTDNAFSALCDILDESEVDEEG